MLVVSLRGVNFEFWSHSVLGKTPSYLALKVPFRVAREKIQKYIFDMYIFNSFHLLHSDNPSFLICLRFNMVSFRGQKKLWPRPDRSPLGFNSKFPTSIPTPFICRVPPGVGLGEKEVGRFRETYNGPMCSGKPVLSRSMI